MANNENGLWGQETKHFHALSPDQVMKAAEIQGQRLSGRILALNSLENRVYDIELTSKLDFGKEFSSTNLILKFYRPGRWSEHQIKEEHHFLKTLLEFEVPVVAPLEVNGTTLHLDRDTNLWFAFFPKVQGRLKDELIKEEIEQAGRLIGRIHNIGSMGEFKNRLALTPQTFIDSNEIALTNVQLIDHQSFHNYLALLPQISQLVQPIFQGLQLQRIHGDFHRGNIVWTSGGPYAVDFDDCLTGPIEQDLWLLFPGKDQYSTDERERFLAAYREMTRKEVIKTNLTEILRTMRMIHFNAWIAKRWEDHSFQRVFPQFTSAQYWDQEYLDLRSQYSFIRENGTGFVF